MLVFKDQVRFLVEPEVQRVRHRIKVHHLVQQHLSIQRLQHQVVRQRLVLDHNQTPPDFHLHLTIPGHPTMGPDLVHLVHPLEDRLSSSVDLVPPVHLSYLQEVAILIFLHLVNPLVDHSTVYHLEVPSDLEDIP